MEQLRREATPEYSVNFDDHCDAEAGEDVVDDWGDSCKGHRCLREKGHTGSHMSSDGANGWVYFIT